MVKKSNTPPKSGKCDLIEGILLGGQQTKASRRSNEDNTPSSMVKKFTKIAEVSSSHEDKEDSKYAVGLLADFNPDLPLEEKERIQIYKTVRNRSKVTA
jgi:hypothetical protein